MPDEKRQPSSDTGETRAERPMSGTSRASSSAGDRGNARTEVLAPGTTFGKYTIVRLIGAGGMGAVYEATHSALHRRYAVKVLHPLYASQDEIRARFIREGESASRITHPNVVSVTDFGLERDTPFLVMEYLEGESLADHLDREHALPVQRMIEWMLPVCAAVSAAHDEGVVHRDLKPDNVFLARRGGTRGAPEITPKVVDFGISKVSDGKLEASLTSTGSMVGTPHYMSPEQMRASKHVDARSDQYSFGVLMYECATGVKPFDAETLYELIQKIAIGSYKKPRELRPELPEGLETVILKAMSQDPAKRYGSMSAVGHALLPFASERTRAIWQDSFAGDADATSGAVASGAVGSTTRMVTMDGAPEVVIQTLARDKASTLSDTGREIEAPRSVRPVTGRPSKRAYIVAGAAAVAVVIAAVTLTHRPTPAPTASATVTTANTSTHPEAPAVVPPSPVVATFRAAVAAEPASATVDFDGQPGGTGIAMREFERDGREHVVTVRAPGFVAQSVVFRDAPPPGRIRLEPEPAVVAPVGPAHAGSEHTRHATGNAHVAAPTAPAPTAPAPTPVAETPAPPAHAEHGSTVGTNGAAIIAP